MDLNKALAMWVQDGEKIKDNHLQGAKIIEFSL